jgi:hypothetical protein
MPSVPDLTPEEIASVMAARSSRPAVEDELPPSLTARLDREVAARVDAELAGRADTNSAPRSGYYSYPRSKERSNDGRVIGGMSMITAIPLMGIVEGTTHGSLAGAVIVMGGVVLVNLAHALSRRKH